MADQADTAAPAPAAPAPASPAPAAPAAAPAPAPAAAPAPAPAEATMTVVMLVGMEGGVSLVKDDQYECAQSEAIRLIEAGFAIPLADKPKEKATKKAPAETR